MPRGNNLRNKDRRGYNVLLCSTGNVRLNQAHQLYEGCTETDKKIVPTKEFHQR
jgi:hypothetical protein